MKIKLTIAAILISLSIFGQTELLPTIAWRTYVSNVVMLTDSTYQFDVMPLDWNEKGAASYIPVAADTTQTYTAAISQTDFTLTYEPNFVYLVSVNGIVTDGYTVSTTTLTITDQIYENDRIKVTYKY